MPKYAAGRPLPKPGLLTTLNFSNYGLPVIRQDLEWSDFSASQHVINVKSAATVATNESIVPVWLKLTYPQKTTLDGISNGKTFRLRANAGGEPPCCNWPQPQQRIRFTMLHNQVASSVSAVRLAGSILTAGIANTQSGRELWVNRTAKAVSAILPVGFRKIDPTKHNYLIVTDKRLQKPAGGFTDIVKGYAAYRASQAGGKHDTLVVDINC